MLPTENHGDFSADWVLVVFRHGAAAAGTPAAATTAADAAHASATAPAAATSTAAAPAAATAATARQWRRFE